MWQCTPGVFHWHYDDEDEVVYILSGEAFIRTEDRVEHRLAAGDVALLPAGSSCAWRVTECVRKAAVLTKHTPQLPGLATRAWHKAFRTVGRTGIGTPAMQPIAAGPAA